MEITIPIINNPKTGLRRSVIVQSLNVDFISESALVVCKLNTFDVNDELYTCSALEYNILLKEKFPESENTLVDWRSYFGTTEFYDDLKTFAEEEKNA